MAKKTESKAQWQNKRTTRAPLVNGNGNRELT
jgi:hypothetical protein